MLFFLLVLAFCYFFLAYTLRSMMISAWALFWWAIHVDRTISSAMFLNETWNQTFSFLSSLWQLQAPICRRMTWKMQWTSERWRPKVQIKGQAGRKHNYSWTSMPSFGERTYYRPHQRKCIVQHSRRACRHLSVPCIWQEGKVSINVLI